MKKSPVKTIVVHFFFHDQTTSVAFSFFSENEKAKAMCCSSPPTPNRTGKKRPQIFAAIANELAQ
jgi:hypothetical protein